MKKTLPFVVLFFMLIACDKSSTGNGGADTDSPSDGWLIPLSEIVDAGAGRDGILSIDSPTFIRASDSDFVDFSDDNIVIGVLDKGIAKAYPHSILNNHEIVNDLPTIISYCPLTGTAFAWDNNFGQISTKFGVSGLLYKDNLILFDRATNSHWSQLLIKCINGNLIGKVPELKKVIETNWGTWKSLYPNTLVLSNNSSTSKRTTVSNKSSKARVHAIIDNEKSKIYRFESFGNGKVINDNFNGKKMLLVGNDNLITSFELDNQTEDLTFAYAFDGTSDILFTDNENNGWNAFGIAVAGPRSGQSLKPTTSLISFEFAITDFYVDATVFQE